MRPWLSVFLSIWCLLAAGLALWPFDFNLRCLICWNGARIEATDGLLLFSSHGMARAAVPAVFNQRLVESGHLRVEMQITPANDVQGGPARILTYSADPFQRNFTVAQDGGNLILRLRSNTADFNARRNELILRDVFLAGQTMHILIVYDTRGISVVLDGVEQARLDGAQIDFASWDANFDLYLGNEATGDRPWFGAIERVMIRSSLADPPLADFDFATGVDGSPGVLRAADLVFPDPFWGFGLASMLRDEHFNALDFVLHVGMLLPVGLLATLLFVRGGADPGAVFVLLAFLLAFALAVEFAQDFTANRTASFFDLLSGFLGGLLGFAGARRWQRRE